MDISTFNRAKAAYDAQEWETAAILFSACMEGPGSGEACHLRGNALMRLGRVNDAIEVYRRAVADPTYNHKGAVYTNLGKAQVAIGQYEDAVSSLRKALEDTSYPGAYKAWLALGGAYSRLGDARSAGVAYRKAALEANNPDPAKALINLGVCFVQMRRPEDAASAYRTALDFSQDAAERDMILSNLGQAYVASNRMVEAVQAFTQAEKDGYQLLPPAQADFDRAKQAAQSLANNISSSQNKSAAGSTADFLSGMSSGVGSIDPLDPTGKSGEIMPSPDQSGFFSLTDEQIEAAGKAAAKNEKLAGKQAKKAKKASKAKSGSRHTGLKVAITLLVIVIIAFVACILAYLVFGMGVPSQTTSIDAVFSSAEQGSTSSEGWADGITSQERADALSDVAVGSTHSIQGLDYDMAHSSVSNAYVVVTLPQGGTISYDVTLDRDGIGWKVASATVSHSSIDQNTFSTSTDTASNTEASTTAAATGDETADTAGTGETDVATTDATGAEGEQEIAADATPEADAAQEVTPEAEQTTEAEVAA